MVGSDQGGIGQRRQVDKPDPVGEVLPHPLRRGDGQAGLADPTRSGQGQQADLVFGEEGAEARRLLLPVDQARRLRGEMEAEWQITIGGNDGP